LPEESRAFYKRKKNTDAKGSRCFLSRAPLYLSGFAFSGNVLG
jgi:hypothetical protein